jgi:hypothetical protein
LTAITSGVLAISYQPLANIGGTYGAGRLTGPPGTFRLAMSGDSRGNIFGTEVVVGPLARGGRIGLIVDVQNTGRYPVVIDGIDPVFPTAVSRGSQLFVASDPRKPEQSLRPAHSFTVPAHGYRSIGVAIDVRDCPPGSPDGFLSTRQIALHYRFGWGAGHTATIPLHEFALSLAGPPSC